MNFRICLAILLLMLCSSTVFAKGHLWYDKDSGLGQCKKIVVFPVEGQYEFLQANDVLGNNIEQRLKGVAFTILARNSQESLIMQDNANLAYLRNTEFSDERERGAAVKEKTNADFYLLCRVREARIQSDWSPEVTEYVTLSAYTVESGGPSGYRKYDESSWTVPYTVEGQYVDLHLLDLEYILYNKQGEKVMLFQNRRQGYGTSEELQFKDCLKEFTVALRDAKKGCAKKR